MMKRFTRLICFSAVCCLFAHVGSDVKPQFVRSNGFTILYYLRGQCYISSEIPMYRRNCNVVNLYLYNKSWRDLHRQQGKGKEAFRKELAVSFAQDLTHYGRHFGCRFACSEVPNDVSSIQYKNENKLRNEVAEFARPEIDVKDVLKPVSSSPDTSWQGKVVDWKGGEEIRQFAHPGDTGEVNMEASITADDVIRAGGFGARDDISSFLPVASDSTDFEATIRDAREYEEPQVEICRPGLGWTGSTETK
ncbi:hypothetical protein FNV43_RR15917 [Rhamnella rubrinervis]|uniref:Uncharacterized protein n=1 Tax=Rhamnella rubrinervis TaxID=2594499 RepID=A0A8K0GXH2_9ROSA|nr:hypothetical protein FNV43_RR15917 [Rhamnella rubrinervis]